MRKIMILLYRLVGRSPSVERKIEQKRVEAHDLVNSSMADVWKAKKEVDKINIKTSQKLTKISKELGSISYRLGVGMGSIKHE